MSDGEIATVTKDGVWVQDINGTPITKKFLKLTGMPKLPKRRF